MKTNEEIVNMSQDELEEYAKTTDDPLQIKKTLVIANCKLLALKIIDLIDKKG